MRRNEEKVGGEEEEEIRVDGRRRTWRAQGERRRPTGGRQRTGSVVSELDPWGGEEAALAR
jgi:hypothetical protein